MPQKQGEVLFYLLTDAGIFTASTSKEDLRNHHHPLSKLHDAVQEAATEFQKILDHRGVVGQRNPSARWPISNLAEPMQLQGDTTRAKAAYQDFLNLWKDADPDIPVLIGAKSEYVTPV